MLERPSRDRRSRPRRREVIVRLLVVALLLAVAFVLGMAFARTLDEQADNGRVVTNERTLTPLPQDPPARTVTVTVTTSP
jgi:Tfp pilus assembly protein PilN